MKIRVEQLVNASTVVSEWPRLVNCGPVQGAELLEMLLSTVRIGALFVVHQDETMIGFACVEIQGNTALITAMPKKVGNEVVKVIREWASTRGIEELTVSTTDFKGSNFRYFRKTLGFHRKSITFALKV